VARAKTKSNGSSKPKDLYEWNLSKEKVTIEFVWPCDFVGQKCVFKPNCRRYPVWECI